MPCEEQFEASTSLITANLINKFDFESILFKFPKVSLIDVVPNERLIEAKVCLHSVFTLEQFSADHVVEDPGPALCRVG